MEENIIDSIKKLNKDSTFYDKSIIEKENQIKILLYKNEKKLLKILNENKVKVFNMGDKNFEDVFCKAVVFFVENDKYLEDIHIYGERCVMRLK